MTEEHLPQEQVQPVQPSLPSDDSVFRARLDQFELRLMHVTKTALTVFSLILVVIIGAVGLYFAVKQLLVLFG